MSDDDVTKGPIRLPCGKERGLSLTVRRRDTVLLWLGERGEDPPDDAHCLDILEVTALAVTCQIDEGAVYRIETDGEAVEVLEGLHVYRGRISDGRPTLRFLGPHVVRIEKKAFDLGGEW